ncbi:MAG: hypothetical protein SVO01_00190 [Thermotogota bacterium]|nr:hypothetical protein [Thermotogota bacterium]
MANTDCPAGFKPVKHLSGAPWNGKANVYYIPSTDDTDTFIGDAVTLQGSADDLGLYPTVAQAAAGDTAIVGVIIGFGKDPSLMADPDTLTMKYREGSTAMYCLVVDDPFVIFEIQEDSVGGSIAAASVGLATNIVVGSGSTTTGKSGMELDSSDVSTNTAGNCRLLRIVNRPDNVLGDHCKWEVLIAEHAYREQVTVTDV